MTSIELTKAQGRAKSFSGGGGGEMPLKEPKKIPVLHFTVKLKKIHSIYRVLVILLQWKTIDVVIKHKLYDNSRLSFLSAFCQNS